MLKSKKRVVIIMSVIAVLFVLLVLGSALFSLQSVKIEFALIKTENSMLATYDKDEMVKTGQFAYGKNILFLNFDQSIEQIEKAYPYAKVVKVTRNFPNSAVVYVTEREPLFKVRQTDGSCYVLDGDLKVLSHSTGQLSDVEESLPEWNSFPILQGVEVGSFIDNDELRQVILSISSAVVDDDVKLNMSVMSSISLENIQGSEDQLLTIVLDDKVTIKITGTNNLLEKALGAFNLYQTEVQAVPEKYPDKTQVVITVTKNYSLENNLGISVSGGVIVQE